MWWRKFHRSHGWLFSCQSLNIFASLIVESSVYIFLRLLPQPVAPIAPFFLITILNPFKQRFSCKYFCFVLVYNAVTFSHVQMFFTELFSCQSLNVFVSLPVISLHILRVVAPDFFSITILKPFKGRFYCKYFCLVLVYSVVTFSHVQMFSAKLFFCHGLNIITWWTVKSLDYKFIQLLFWPIAPFSIVKVWKLLLAYSYGCHSDQLHPLHPFQLSKFEYSCLVDCWAISLPLLFYVDTCLGYFGNLYTRFKRIFSFVFFLSILNDFTVSWLHGLLRSVPIVPPAHRIFSGISKTISSNSQPRHSRGQW